MNRMEPRHWLGVLFFLVVFPAAGYFANGSVGFWAGLTLILAITYMGYCLAVGKFGGTLAAIPFWIFEMWLVYAHKGGDYMEEVIHYQGSMLNWIFSIQGAIIFLAIAAILLLISWVLKYFRDTYNL